MRLRGNTESFQHLHAGPGHAALQYGGNGRRAVTDGARLFAVGANHKARLIDKADNRQMETVAEIGKAAQLLRRRCGHGTGIIHAIITDNADAFAIKTGQAGNEASPNLRDISKKLEASPSRSTTASMILRI